jgi:hypothetical protein
MRNKQWTGILLGNISTLVDRYHLAKQQLYVPNIYINYLQLFQSKVKLDVKVHKLAS